MPEAFAVVFVFIVAVASYVGAKLHTANPANHDARADLVRLQQQRAWLDERLRQGGRENWDQDMIRRITGEIEATEAALAKARGR